VLTCAALIDELPETWTDAVEHRFLESVAEGETEPFAQWLPQDVLFVTDLIAFQARLVARAPRSAQPVLAGGVVGLLSELDWFDETALTLGLPATAPAHATTLRYRELLARLDTDSYASALVGLWVLERIYLEAWRYAARVGRSDRYLAAIEHWTDPAFAAYVTALEAAADEALDDPTADFPGVRQVVRDVLEHEIAFWDMALEATR
jgi:thiaminase